MVNSFQWKLSQRLGADGKKTIRRIEDVPVAGRGLGKEAESHVAESADERHFLQSYKIAETIAFGVIRFALDQRQEQCGQMTDIHLSIAVNLDDNLCAEFQRFAEA